LKWVLPAIRELFARGVGACLAVSIASSPRVAEAQGVSSEVRPPQVVERVDAIYPVSELGNHRHADVVLNVTVDAEGQVRKAEVIESGGPAMDEAARAAVLQWTFHPALRAGQPVASRIRVPFHFAPPSTSAEPEGPPAPPLPPPPLQPSTVGPAAPAPAVAPTHVENVQVLGRKEPPSRGASDFNLRVGALKDIPRKSAAELLKLAPGILLTNEGGEGHADQVFLRGFDAKEGQDIEFTVGGVPINESGNLHGNGYSDTHFIIPELVESLRVVEGPFDPRQGNYAVAGSADYQLGLEKRGLTAKFTTGSWNTQRMLLMWGPDGASNHTFVGAELYGTNGYGQNRDAQRASAIAQYEGRLGSKGSYRITSQAYATNYHSAGVIRQDDFTSGKVGFYDTYDPGQGGDGSRYSLAGDMQTETGDTLLSQQFFFIDRGMRLRENFTGYLLDVQEPLQEPHAQRGDLLDLNVSEQTIGARGYARTRGDAFGQRQQLELGYYARGDSVSSTQQRLTDATLIPYKTDVDLDSRLGDIGLYADANLRAARWLNLRGGLRGDLFAYDVINNCAVQSIANPPTINPPIDQSCLSLQNNSVHREPDQRSSTASVALLPKGTLLMGPFDHFTFSGAVGKGVRSIDPIYITQDIATPFASVLAIDAGVVYARTFHDLAVVARSNFFQTDVDQDLVFDQTVGRNVIGAGTVRNGWVGALRATGDWFDESANVTVVRSVYNDNAVAESQHIAGLLVPYIPNVVVRSDSAVFGDLPIHLLGKPFRGAVSAGVTFVGKRPLPFGAVSDTILTIDASTTLSWTHYEVGLIATNLLNTQYKLGEYNYVSNWNPTSPPTLVPQRLFTAGAPLGVFATFAVNFGGKS
jgi:iron complex outermembrane receptor protein